MYFRTLVIVVGFKLKKITQTHKAQLVIGRKTMCYKWPDYISLYDRVGIG